jgi:hypothetical protein
VTNDTNHSAYTSTGGMSANSTGTVSNMWLYDDKTSAPTVSGSALSITATSATYVGTSSRKGYGIERIAVNVAHTHSHNHVHSLPANTGSTGSGTAVNVMNPYIVKYCWERTE